MGGRIGLLDQPADVVGGLDLRTEQAGYSHDPRTELADRFDKIFVA